MMEWLAAASSTPLDVVASPGSGHLGPSQGKVRLGYTAVHVKREELS